MVGRTKAIYMALGRTIELLHTYYIICSKSIWVGLSKVFRHASLVLEKFMDRMNSRPTGFTLIPVNQLWVNQTDCMHLTLTHDD